MKKITLLLLFLTLLVNTGRLYAQINNSEPVAPSTKPVLKVDVPNPTADKPQSKLWYADKSWWALLPTSSGPSLWQRTAGGWTEHAQVRALLQGIPGRADVWADQNEIMAVGVDKHVLTVFAIRKVEKASKITWMAEVRGSLSPSVSTDEMETATIAKDKTGCWWVAADAGEKVCVWSSSSKNWTWTPPYVLAKGLNADDICTVAELPGQTAIIWSDQNRDAVSMRTHRNGQPADRWEDTVVIEQGNKTADDHLHASLATDGTLWLATKNSVDQLGSPQQVLRVRHANGQWRNYAYADLDVVKAPSRPVVIATQNPALVLAGHTIYNHKNANLGEIVFGRVDTSSAGLLRDVRTVIAPDATGWTKRNKINDITVPKKPFPDNAPWIILASDEEGNVFEADLKPLFFKP
ncbi:hypothetical protein DYBT9275_04262 [Dyadobacter sp. CECT 9275]|uniref:Uncharacterized protein n=1 Tax=Dyadobacter helix TaxID=2822344 RepID=A0A916NMS1_9BACT|nr:hypothetical protein [Dyadobacter sp. CECT 9275]CAG5008413.1 hypothetical protein DYBT9275_04262 [Dyadobacter sp. CECT 9275]